MKNKIFIPQCSVDISRHDEITVISSGLVGSLADVGAVADTLAKEGISVEIWLDLRMAAPLDRETVLSSFKKSGRAS